MSYYPPPGGPSPPYMPQVDPPQQPYFDNRGGYPPPQQPYYSGALPPNAYPYGQQQYLLPNGSPYGAPYGSPYQSPPPQQSSPYGARPVSPYQHAGQSLMPSPGPSGGPFSLPFCDGGKHAMILTTPDKSSILFTACYKSSSFSSGPDVTLYRGSQPNIPIGSVNYHTWSSKIDLEVNGRAITYKDDFDSNEGLGRLYWKYVGKKKEGNLRCEDRSGQIVAGFTFSGWDQSEVGRVEIWRPGLSQAQMDEVVSSAVAEIEGMRREMADSGVNAGVVGGLSAVGC